MFACRMAVLALLSHLLPPQSLAVLIAACQQSILKVEDAHRQACQQLVQHLKQQQTTLSGCFSAAEAEVIQQQQLWQVLALLALLSMLQYLLLHAQQSPTAWETEHVGRMLQVRVCTCTWTCHHACVEVCSNVHVRRNGLSKSHACRASQACTAYVLLPQPLYCLHQQLWQAMP